MLKQYTIKKCDSLGNVFFETFNIFDVVKERLEGGIFKKSKKLSNFDYVKVYQGDFFSDFLTYHLDFKSEEIYYDDEYPYFSYFTIESGFGKTLNVKDFYFYYLMQSGLYKKAKECFFSQRKNYPSGFKQSKRVVKGTFYRKPRKTSFIKELRDNINSKDSNVNVRKKRSNKAKHGTFGGYFHRKENKSWKNSVKCKKQWMKKYI